jgi:hypothetical protein
MPRGMHATFSLILHDRKNQKVHKNWEWKRMGVTFWLFF